MKIQKSTMRKIGACTIHKACSFSMLPTLESQSVDLILTDPPYILKQEQKLFLMEQFTRISKTGFILFSPPENQWPNPKQYGFWVKPQCTRNVSKSYARFVEMLFFYGNLKWITDSHWSQYANLFFDFVEVIDHPHAKPPSLIKRLLRNHSESGDLILDPFCGGGNLLSAGLEIGRKMTGIEIKNEWFDMSVRKIEQFASPRK